MKKRINNISKLGISKEKVKDFFEVWKGLYNFDAPFTDKEYFEIIKQHYTL